MEELPLGSNTAQASLEDLPVSTIAPNLPYVVKSPWSYQPVEEMLADPQIRVDAVIVPLRERTQAVAASLSFAFRYYEKEQAGWRGC